MAQETLQRGKVAAEQAQSRVEEGAFAAVENLQDLSVTLIEMAHANIDAAFEFAHQAATARTPTDIVNLWSTHLAKQLRLITEQAQELAQRGQKLANRSSPPIVPRR